MKRSTKLVSAIVLAILILGGGGWYFYTSSNSGPNYEFVVVTRGNLLQEVNVTGKVKPVDMVNLGFSTNGTLESMPVKVGDTVIEGQLLATLDDDELQSDLAQGLAALSSAQAQLAHYQALLDKEKATLADLENGTPPEEIVLQEVRVSNALISLNLAKDDVLGTLEDAYTKADDAVREKLDVIFASPRSVSPSIIITATNSALESSVEIKRPVLETQLTNWRSSLDSLTVDDNLITATSDAKIVVSAVRQLLDDASKLVAGALPNGSITQTVLDSYASDISTGRTSVSTAYSNILAEESALNTAEANLKVAENELKILQAGTTAEKINAQKAAVAQALANLSIQQGAINEVSARVAKTRTLLAKTSLRSPIAGIVTSVAPEVGESITANAEIFSVISGDEFQIESDITETDVVLIALGQPADVTLDAYGDDVVFKVVVSKIDPAEKVIEGVPTYRVTFTFAEPDARIRSGMTANIDVLTGEKHNIITVPQRAIVTTDGKRYVRIIQSDNSYATIPVMLGLRGSDGNVEIIEGVSEGDRVITYIEEE